MLDRMACDFDESRFLDGLSRVARPIEHNPNYDQILGSRLETFFRSHAVADEDFSPTLALAIFDRMASRKKQAIHMIPPRAAVAYGKTRNNLREFAFLRSLLTRHGLDNSIFNLSLFQTSLAEPISAHPSVAEARNCFLEYLKSRWPLSRASVFQLINFFTAYFAWDLAFRTAGVAPRVLVQSNDHSPHQVACTMLAQSLDIPTVYLQHAEVTEAFPSLIFDVSILRNRASRDIYASVGPVAGAAHVISRDFTPFDKQGFQQAVKNKVCVGVYLTAEVQWHGVHRVLDLLSQNVSVDRVFVKPHPSLPDLMVRLELPDTEVRNSIPAEPHVAVVANSSVVVELIHLGNVTLQNFSMDSVPDDYYGFSRQGIAPEVRENELTTDFWHRFCPDDNWLKAYGRYDPWADGDHEEAEQSLVSKLRDFFPATKSRVRAPKQHIVDGAVGKSAAELTRDLISLVPNTVVEYVNEPSSAPMLWSSGVQELDFISALEGVFAEREFGAYDLYASTRRVRKVDSEIVYHCKRRDIELTGRPTEGQELSEISEYVQRNDKDWRHRIEFLFLLIRLGQSNRICDLYGGGTPIPVRKLGINRRVALSKWLSDKPMAQVALNRVPADLYLGLLPFQKLKMRILTCEAEAFARRSWGHQEVERQFSEYTSSSLRDELDARFVPAYDIIRSQMRFMEVRWCARQRAEFSDLVSSCLQTKTPFSMVRLSDREAYMFADGSRYFTLADVESCERHWWRVQLARDQRERLACLMRSASDNADVLGVPSIYRLLRETDVKSKSFLSSLQGRGLTEVAHHVSLRSQPGQLFTEEKANVHLFDDLGSIAAISRSAGRIVLIASASEPEIRSVFEPFGQLCYIPIPTHSRTMGNDKYAAERTSLPLVYEQIREQIALTVQPGDLVLVAGGVIGKIFLHDAKRAGGVALDIGTCLDSWVGARIQSLT